MDGRTAPYRGCWKGEYLDDTRQADEYSITEYDLETFNYYIVQESLLGSLFYYTVSQNEIWEISKTFFKLSSRPYPPAFRSASFLSFAMLYSSYCIIINSLNY